MEEPQAAFLFWLEQHASKGGLAHAFPLKSGVYSLLVIDIGGGTSDLPSLSLGNEQQDARLRGLLSAITCCLAVTTWTALAHRLESQLVVEGKLARKEWQQLVAQSRQLKERALSGSISSSAQQGAFVSGSEVASQKQRVCAHQQRRLSRFS
jgi:molecular chaperone DnaK (HSP70)